MSSKYDGDMPTDTPLSLGYIEQEKIADYCDYLFDHETECRMDGLECQADDAKESRAYIKRLLKAYACKAQQAQLWHTTVRSLLGQFNDHVPQEFKQDLHAAEKHYVAVIEHIVLRDQYGLQVEIDPENVEVTA